MHGHLSRRDLFRRAKSQDQLDLRDAVRNDSNPVIANITSNCLTFNQITCRICEEHCDQDAISFRPHLGGKQIPFVDQTACNGCGDCASVCPNKSIHFKAKPRVTDS